MPALPLTISLGAQEDPRLTEELPSGFQDLERAGKLSLATLQMIRRFNTKRDWDLRGSKVTKENAGDKARHELLAQSQGQHFWNVCNAFRPSDVPHRATLERLICMALLRYCFNSIMPPRPRACICHTATEQLTALLPTFKVPASQMERDCLIWVWLMTIDSWSVSNNRGELEPTGMQLMSQLRANLPELADWGWRDLEATGHKFFWRDDIGILLEAYWSLSASAD